jgi:hypothetical protein
VIAKIGIGASSSTAFGQRTDELLGHLYALGGKIQEMLEAIASDPRNFQIQFGDNTSWANHGIDNATGLDTYAVNIDYDWVESDLIYVSGDGIAQNSSAEAMLAHELSHLYYWDHPDGHDPR